jgi:hypothetical protein
VQLEFGDNVHFLFSPQYLALILALAIASLELDPTVFPVSFLTTFHGLFDPLTYLISYGIGYPLLQKIFLNINLHSLNRAYILIQPPKGLGAAGQGAARWGWAWRG